MREIEKAQLGMLYDANYDEEINRIRGRVQRKIQRFNRIPRRFVKLKRRLLRSVLGKVGEGFVIEQPFFCDYGYNVEIGDFFYSNYNLIILDAVKVKIGDHVFIGPNVGIYTAGHPLEVEKRNQGLEYALPVVIGNNVWIGAGTMILPGVTIGDNVTIGAGSVVARNIPDDVLAFGNPCRVIRQLNRSCY